MSPTSTAAAIGASARTHFSDRRVHQRFPMSLNVEYKFLIGGHVECQGFCLTVNISSHGTLLRLPNNLPSLKSIDLSIKWPVLLRGTVPLKLVVRGRVVRNDGDSIAVKFLEHEFRTATSRY